MNNFDMWDAYLPFRALQERLEGYPSDYVEAALPLSQVRKLLAVFREMANEHARVTAHAAELHVALDDLVRWFGTVQAEPKALHNAVRVLRDSDTRRMAETVKQGSVRSTGSAGRKASPNG